MRGKIASRYRLKLPRKIRGEHRYGNEGVPRHHNLDGARLIVIACSWPEISCDSSQRSATVTPNVVTSDAWDEIEGHGLCVVALERAARIGPYGNDAAWCE